MADCDWIILCDYAFPGMHGKLCMVGIFDLIFAPDVPVRHPRAAVGFYIIGEPGESVHMTLKIIAPTGADMLKFEQPIVLPEAGSAFGHIEVQNLELKEFGRYAIEIALKGGEGRTAWFTLRQVQVQK